ncbi:hypothetical protein GCM10008956_31460 [Deinococcus arenae]|uniref:Uncharacterized protein n=1 Tax=Deinococcus arenae TaxID=1452751 RepID=A0A8H9GW22_9DEIO|nr:hypothetical protein GCM10008956_31460 [Deinococcus arenae]
MCEARLLGGVLLLVIRLKKVVRAREAGPQIPLGDEHYVPEFIAELLESAGVPLHVFTELLCGLEERLVRSGVRRDVREGELTQRRCPVVVEAARQQEMGWRAAGRRRLQFGPLDPSPLEDEADEQVQRGVTARPEQVAEEPTTERGGGGIQERGAFGIDCLNPSLSVEQGRCVRRLHEQGISQRVLQRRGVRRLTGGVRLIAR